MQPVRKKLGRVGFTCGAFDLCHAGHLLLFKDAKEVCDYLIVGLQIDPSVDNGRYRDEPKNKPVMSVEERRIILENVKHIDEIFIYRDEAELYEILRCIPYDVYILGSDWRGKRYTGFDLPHIPYFHERDHPYSTTGLRERIFTAECAKRGIPL